ncbi:MAG: protein kinase [Myxococcales bacterium]|nr:protein kinase [Myxococcales bacterium]
MDPLIGRVIGGRFRVVSLLARGGMGKVYRAEQSPLGRVCAIKVLNPSYAGEHDPEFHKRFFLEASIASKLTHPNTVTIFDYGRTDDDIYFMAMEYLEGYTLHRAIRESGHLAEDRAVHISQQICRALREAHAIGVIHRDLKPANIFLVEHGDEADFVKVLDFGLVKLADNKGEDLTQTGMFMGSPKYMSPEQIRGDRIDARSDVYALGIMMYEMLTGKVPFDRPNSVNILMAHVTEEPPALRAMNPAISVSAWLEETVGRCLAKDPAHRFQSMDELLSALKRASGVAPLATITGLEATERGSMIGSGPRGERQSRDSLRPGPGPVPGPGMDSLAPRAGPEPSSSRRKSAAPEVAGRPLPGSSARGSTGALMAAVVGALILAGTVGYGLMRPSPRSGAAPRTAPMAALPPQAAGPSTSEPVAQASTLSPVLAPTVTTPAPEAPPPAAKLRVSTDPDGATVREDGALVCTSTPCDILYRGTDADPDREHKLTLARPGFRSETRSAKVGDSPLSVKLAPLARALPPAAPRAEVPSPVPTGYKTEIPY